VTNIIADWSVVMLERSIAELYARHSLPSLEDGLPMSSSNHSDIERRVRSALEAQDPRNAATRALENFGPDILRFLSARLADRAQTEDAYLQFSEDVWVGLPAFRWESSLHTWMFVLARTAATRVYRKRRREVELPPGFAGYAQLNEHVRNTTARFLRMDIKDRMREIRQRLDEDDQTLLILRIDRKLDWSALAVVMNEVASDAQKPDVERAVARVQTRFQTAKKQLRDLAEAEGLVTKRAEST
jgi:RNA polymerase sigma-70 factor (ECF subfamily)